MRRRDIQFFQIKPLRIEQPVERKPDARAVRIDHHISPAAIDAHEYGGRIGRLGFRDVGHADFAKPLRGSHFDGGHRGRVFRVAGRIRSVQS